MIRYEENLYDITYEELQAEALFQNLNVSKTISQEKLIKKLIRYYNKKEIQIFTPVIKTKLCPKYTLQYLCSLSNDQWHPFRLMFRLENDTPSDVICSHLAKYLMIVEKDEFHIHNPSFSIIWNLCNSDLCKELTRRRITHIKDRYSKIIKLLTYGYSNPYELLSENQLKIIIKERSLTPPFVINRTSLIHHLTRVDKHDNNWPNICRHIDIGSNNGYLNTLSLGMLLYYLAYNQLNVYRTNLEDFTVDHTKELASIALNIGVITSSQPPCARESYILYDQSVDHITDQQKRFLIRSGYQISHPIFEETYQYPVIANNPDDLHYKNNSELYQTSLLLNIDIGLYPYYTYEDLIFILTRGQVPQLQLDPGRYHSLCALNKDQLQLLSHVYNIDDDDVIPKLGRMEPSSLETLIISISDNNPIRTVMSNAGMIIPYDVNPWIYCQENIYHYRSVINSDMNDDNFYSRLTDYDIFKHHRAYWSYINRLNLIEVSQQLQKPDAKQFFIPVNNRKCYNKHTTVSYNDTSDPTVFIIGYGNLTGDYLGFELDDVISSFTIGKDGGYNFIIPYPDVQMKNSKFFTIDEIHQFRRLLNGLCNCDPKLRSWLNITDDIKTDCQEVLSKIHKGLSAHITMNEYGQKLRKTYTKYSNSTHKAIINVLIKVFEIGMYARRWLGEGHPYPCTSAESEVKLDPTLVHSNVTLALAAYNEEMMKLKSCHQTFIHNLHSYRLVNGSLVYCPKSSLKDVIVKVGTNNECFRMISVVLIGTAYYYLRLLCHYTIPNFNEQQLDHVM